VGGTCECANEHTWTLIKSQYRWILGKTAVGIKVAEALWNFLTSHAPELGFGIRTSFLGTVQMEHVSRFYGTCLLHPSDLFHF